MSSEAKRVYCSDLNDEEQINYKDHKFHFGGVGDGYCYGHQSFDCIERLSREDWEMINAVE